MSESAAPQNAVDPIKDLARTIYIALAGNTYAGAPTGGPDPKALAMLAFKLSDAFWQADREINAVAIAEAKSVATFTAADLDFGTGSQPKK